MNMRFKSGVGEILSDDIAASAQMDATIPAPRCAVHEFQIGESILCEKEAVMAVVTALGDVLRDADQVEPGWSGHDLTPGLKP